MKNVMILAVLAALTAPAAMAGNTATSSSSSNSGAVAGVIINEGGSTHSTHIGGTVGLNSMNNSPCGRTTIGINSSGHNCTYREETILMAELLHRCRELKQRSSCIALTHWASNDESVRNTLVHYGWKKRQ